MKPQCDVNEVFAMRGDMSEHWKMSEKRRLVEGGEVFTAYDRRVSEKRILNLVHLHMIFILYRRELIHRDGREREVR